MLDAFWLFVSSDGYWSGVFSGVLLGLAAGVAGMTVALLFREASDELLDRDFNVGPTRRSADPAGTGEDEPGGK